jgi:hypothetical protein
MENEKPKSEIQKHYRVLTDKLKRFLSKESPSDVLIIKAHLICEYYLNQILILRELCTSKDLSKFTFNDKLEKSLDKTDGKEKDSFEAIKKLNKLRNKIGHELEYSLSESDIDDLGFLRGKEYILEKYDFETLPELLRNTLTIIVIDLSFIVFSIVDSQKKGPEKPRL